LTVLVAVRFLINSVNSRKPVAAFLGGFTANSLALYASQASPRSGNATSGAAQESYSHDPFD
jgi:hypothetical protein